MSNPNNPELLYVINHIDWFWSHRLPLAKGAQDTGWDVSVAVPDADQDSKLGDHGFTGLNLPVGLFKTIVALHRLMKDRKPALVHAITIKYAFMTGLAARLHPDVKAVYTIAGLGYLFSGEGFKPKLLRTLIGPFLRLALRRKNTQLIFQNPDDMKIMIDRGLASPEQSHLIRGSGVDTAEFTPQPEAVSDTPVVVMPTRLIHDKGVAIFVEAARILKKRGVHAKFQIAGGVTDNPLAISTKQMKALVADGAAEWLGRVSDMPALLASCALVAYPSYYREGIPKVLLESAAMGRAIVTTDHAGCREAVRHDYNGLLVPVKDPQALADAIETCLADPEKRAAMGVNSRQRAVDEFDVRHIAKQTIAVYDR